MLPRSYPNWKSVYDYFRRWRDDDTWKRIHDMLRAELRQKMGRDKHAHAGCMDSQSVKSTQIPGVRGYDSGKQIKGRKRHLPVDTVGLTMADDGYSSHGGFSLGPGGCKAGAEAAERQGEVPGSGQETEEDMG